MMVGLCGSHRTGKSSLAQAYAQEAEIAYLEVSVSAIFKALGYDSSSTDYDFKTRLTIQEKILSRIDVIYSELDPSLKLITDRTPLDMLAYTTAEAIGTAVGPREQKRFAEYAKRCFEVTNKRFSTLVLVQPGIPLIKGRGKGVTNPAYMEHLNSLIMGMSVDPRCGVPNFYVPRATLDMADRISCVRIAVGKSEKVAEGMKLSYLSKGGAIH